MQKLLRPEISATSYIQVNLFVDSSHLNRVSFYLLVQESEFNTPSSPPLLEPNLDLNSATMI